MTTTEIEQAIEELAGVFGDGWTSSDVGGGFTCREADIIARLLVLSGHKDAALTWLTGHAQGDDDGDDHYYQPEDASEDESRALNEAELIEYVEGLAL